METAINMIRWYADNSYLRGIWGAETDDILIFGGIALDIDAIQAISSIMEKMKSPYKKEADFPVKWNMRDLEEFYKKKDLVNLYKALLRDSKEWRCRIFQEAADIEFTIIIALIKAYSRKGEVIKENKERLTRYVFIDALQRVGHHAKEINAGGVEIILDWPDRNQPRSIFDEEYQSALVYGVTCEQQKYDVGPLKGLGFTDSIHFTSMKACSNLQFTDLIVGTTREFVNLALKRDTETFGFDCLKELNKKFRGAPNNIIGRGLIIAPTSGEFANRVKGYIPKLFT